ncbi:MAG: methylase [Bacteroidales bacterium]|nr:methylase [Bacteroidales bacterium]
MSWMRAVCGRLEMRYRYSAAIVYNNFPWPLRVSVPLCEKITSTARAILDARAAHPGATLADLYDPLTMPPDLLAAHRANDRAVMTAYGFDLKMSESDCVAALFKLYQRLTTTN